MRKGIRYQSEHLACLALVGPSDIPARFAVTVSAKIDKRATARNRMKRLVRDALQKLLSTIPTGMRCVFMVRGRLPDNQHDVSQLVKKIVAQVSSVYINKGNQT